jgi:hypothetical protein
MSLHALIVVGAVEPHQTQSVQHLVSHFDQIASHEQNQHAVSESTT